MAYFTKLSQKNLRKKHIIFNPMVKKQPRVLPKDYQL